MIKAICKTLLSSIVMGLPVIIYLSTTYLFLQNFFIFIMICLGIIYGAIDILLFFSYYNTDEEEFQDKEYNARKNTTLLEKISVYIAVVSLLVSTALCIYFGYIISAFVTLFVISPSLWFSIHVYRLPERTEEELKAAKHRKFINDLSTKIADRVLKR